MAVSIGARPAPAKATTVSVEARPAPAKAIAVSLPHRHKRAKAMAVSIGARPAPAKAMTVSVEARPTPAKATPVSDNQPPGRHGLTAVPVGGGRAVPDNEPTRRATHQRHKPHWCEGHRRDRRAWLRCPWAAAGPGRASRSTAPSRRLACGDLAGGQPPTGTPSSPARQRIQKRPPETGWAYLSRLWESNPRPIHYE